MKIFSSNFFSMGAAVIAFLTKAVISYAQEPAQPDSLTLPDKLCPGNHKFHLVVNQLKRSAVIHVPPNYDPDQPTPVVLALHGAVMTGQAMSHFTGLNSTADKNGFIVVYPNGTGYGPVLTWNAGGFSRELAARVDDVAFLSKLIDEISAHGSIDSKRIYACGMSNGGMMCYRLAAELSERIAAIAPVGGTMPNAEPHPGRPVSVIHFHGTLDTLVPYDVGEKSPAVFLKLKSVKQSIQTWAKVDGCPEQPASTDVLSKDGDDLKVVRKTYGPGNEDTEVVLVTIENGGHTWPGQKPPVKFLGKSALNIAANDLIWDFFVKHPMK